jgi:apolipoprotein N-acyltransferase
MTTTAVATASPRPKRARAVGLVLPALGALPLWWPLAYAGALLSGLLYWLAFAGMDVWPLAFVAWVPLIVSMHRQTVRRATLLGWVAGVSMNVFGFYWLEGMLKTFSGFNVVICSFFVLVVCGYQGARIAMLGWLYGRASARGWPAPIVFAAAFAASELFYPLLFPWFYAATVHQVPVLTQTGDLGGPILVGLVLVAANIALAEPLLARLERRKPNVRVIAVGAATLAVALGYGALRISSVDAAAAGAPPATVGVVQANMGLMEKRTSYNDGLRRHQDATLRLAREKNIDFVVWSETSAMRPVRDETYQQELRSGVSRGLGVPAIFGAVTVKEVPDERRYVYYNTAVSSTTDGTINGRYDKEFLLMFGEYLPFGDTFTKLYEWSPHSGRFTPGTDLDPLFVELKGVRHPVTALICYEDILPRFTNEAVRHGDPELLVNMTNDAWFGDTVEPWEHLALAQLRAVEHRRYLVRGTNSGVSAVVDPVGRVVAHSGTFAPETLSATIHWMRGWTVYEKVGDWPWLLGSLALVVGCFRARRTSPRDKLNAN